MQAHHSEVFQGKSPDEIRVFLEDKTITAVERKGKYFWCALWGLRRREQCDCSLPPFLARWHGEAVKFCSRPGCSTKSVIEIDREISVCRFVLDSSNSLCMHLGMAGSLQIKGQSAPKYDGQPQSGIKLSPVQVIDAIAASFMDSCHR
jgi:formamidopyrimidine-DNA glycosylase